MLDLDFTSLLSIGERPSVEFKGPGSLKDGNFLAKVARAVLALSNLRDGGRIVIGVQNQANTAVGLSEEQLAEWRNRDHVLDAVSADAAPSVELELDYEPESRRCVTLQVKQFRSLPVICKQTYQSGKEIILRKGSFYCRPVIGRPRSVEANEPELVREILDLAIELGLKSFIAQSVKAGTIALLGSPPATPSDEEKYKKQRGDL